MHVGGDRGVAIELEFYSTHCLMAIKVREGKRGTWELNCTRVIDMGVPVAVQDVLAFTLAEVLETELTKLL